jgi:hypothetical protein
VVQAAGRDRVVGSTVVRLHEQDESEYEAEQHDGRDDVPAVASELAHDGINDTPVPW